MPMKDMVKWQLLQQMPGFIAVLAEPDHRFEFVNDAYVSLAGPREYVGMTVREVFHDLDGEAYFSALDGVYRTGQAYDAKAMEFRYKGEPEAKYMDFRYQPITDETGAVVGIFVSGNDVTERVVAEQKLKAHAERLSALVKASSEVRYAMSPDWSEMYMLSGGGFLADTTGGNDNWLADYIHPADQPVVKAAFQDAIDRKVPFSFEHRVLLANGDIGWTYSRAVPIYDEHGNIKEWFGAASDITSRKSTEAALKNANDVLEQTVAKAYEERNLFADIIETTDVAVQVLDEDFRFVAINKATINEYETLFGFKAKVGDRMLDLIPREDWRADLKKVWDRALAGENYIYTEEYGDPERTRRFYETRFRHLTLDGGRKVAYALGYDVTSRVNEAKHLAAVEGQLRQAQKMEAVGQLTGGLAHDFNNLLTGVMGNLELLNRRVMAGKLEGLERYISGAQGAGRRAASLTQRLLAFSRRQTLDPKPTDVNRLATGILEMLERTVGPAIALSFVGAPGLWAVNIDAGQLENSLLNLCINSRDAMPNGGAITLETSNEMLGGKEAAELELRPGEYLKVCVADTGAGMSQETITRAFEPFYTTKPIGQGTGLGLSMIYGFARQSGGNVQIRSEEGRGTEICIYLPRFDGVVELPGKRIPAEDAGQGTGYTILVVDDEAPIRHLVIEELNEHQYTVLSAPDGPSAVKLLETGVKLDLLITDVGLPNGMNGRQVADAARQRVPDLRVLFITGYAETAAIGNGDLAHGMSLLTKPFELDALARKVKAILEN